MREAGPVLSLLPLDPPPPHTHLEGQGRQDCGRAQSKVAVLAITQNAAYQRDIDCGAVELLGAWKLGRL